jgi:Ca2+-transporting ATPase
MRAPPRRPDQKLFDKTVMARGLAQGVGLLLLLLAVVAGARAWLPDDAQRDDTARALAFVVLVLSNLGLIQANRAWGRSAVPGRAESSRFFGWIAAGTVIVLGVVLAVPPVSRLFLFAAPTPLMLLAAVGLAGLSVFWFEAVKRMQTGALRPAAGSRKPEA